MASHHLKKPPRQQRRRQPTDFSERTYRQRIGIAGLEAFHVICQETDLMIQADKMLEREAFEQVLACRAQIEAYIERYPAFASTLKPWPSEDFAPPIVRQMIQAGQAAGVGPMAAVAGTIAEDIARHLLIRCKQAVVENGGDIFLKTNDTVVVGLFAGNSPLSMKLGIKLPPASDGVGICTSSGTVGHSLSTGSADAVCVISPSCALADASATAIGNRIHSSKDINNAIHFGKSIPGISGIIVVRNREIGAWGSVELVPGNRKKG
jgi:ApbE superfamily uncharacterized protein (UPF0280 family)